MFKFVFDFFLTVLSLEIFRNGSVVVFKIFEIVHIVKSL